jgi:uncharacterized protein YerC
MIRRAATSIVLAVVAVASVHVQSQETTTAKSEAGRVARLEAMARDSSWSRLPLGMLMTKLGHELLGTPYVGGTLEGDGPEVCRVRLDGLDCVTFFETVLNLARNLKHGTSGYDRLLESITQTRYRSGRIDGYTSRLHYTTEWILDNAAKGIVTDISRQLGGRPMQMKLDFMSTHPQYYPALGADASAIQQIAKIEQRLQMVTMHVVPREKVADIESELRDGDIVAIMTSKKGLDYAHTGIIVREGRRARFMHASSTKKQVVLDGYLADVIARVDTWTGISVARPNEVGF